MRNSLPMGHPLEKSGFRPRGATLERNQARGDQSPSPKGAAQEGGLPRESWGCPGRRPGPRLKFYMENQSNSEGDAIRRRNIALICFWFNLFKVLKPNI